MTAHEHTRSEGEPTYGRDLVIGSVHRLGSHHLSEAEVVEFASTWDPQYFHTDVHSAADSPYGGLIASGLHTLAIYQRLTVHSVYRDWAVIAGRSIGNVQFLRPVRPGDTLTGSVTITGLAHDDRDRTLISTVTELTNQEDKVAMTVDADAYLWAGPADVRGNVTDDTASHRNATGPSGE